MNSIVFLFGGCYSQVLLPIIRRCFTLFHTHTHVKGNNRQSIDLWPSRKEMDVNLLLQQHQLFFQLLWYGGRFNHPAVIAQPRAVVVLWPQLYSSPRRSGCNWKLSFCIYSVPMPKKSTNLPTSFNYIDVLFKAVDTLILLWIEINLAVGEARRQLHLPLVSDRRGES